VYTGEIGIGIKVSKETIREIVKANHLQELFEVEWPESNISIFQRNIWRKLGNP
jgi:hypothetical protein